MGEGDRCGTLTTKITCEVKEQEDSKHEGEREKWDNCSMREKTVFMKPSALNSYILRELIIAC